MENKLKFEALSYIKIFNIAIIDIRFSGIFHPIKIKLKHPFYDCFFLGAFGFIVVNNFNLSLPKMMTMEKEILGEKMIKKLKIKERINNLE